MEFVKIKKRGGADLPQFMCAEALCDACCTPLVVEVSMGVVNALRAVTRWSKGGTYRELAFGTCPRCAKSLLFDVEAEDTGSILSEDWSVTPSRKVGVETKMRREVACVGEKMWGEDERGEDSLRLDVIDCHDEPLMFTSKNARGGFSLSSFFSEEGDKREWLKADLSARKHNLLVSGSVDIRDTLRATENNLLHKMTEVKVEGVWWFKWETIPCSDIDPDHLCAHGEFVV